MRRPTVLMAGGGTGGHVFPMLAVAHALRKLCPDIRPVFVGTARGMETRLVPDEGFELELLSVLPIRGGGLFGASRGAVRACSLLPECRALIRKYKPCAVFSVGGYAAGPVSLAARTLGLPVALLEPNSVIGLANWLIAPFIQRAYTAFKLAETNFSPSVVLPSGVPLRSGFEPKPYRPPSDHLRVLVLGGSQGAKSLNEIVPEALSGVEAPMTVLHQCGREYVDAVVERYRGLRAGRSEVTAFIDDMPAALRDADLVIGRAGAGAVSEITAIGRPSLLIPYPFASGDHQRLNAESLQREGAAVCLPNVELTVARLRDSVSALLGDRARLETMARAARHLGRPDAATVIALDFLALAGISRASLTAGPTGGERSLYMPYGEVA
jgi:UDP-N-acetylglucosamine--N-acetylmuramyl-(pentapeptide) pyrophosphoryl-undecaprenol N-acetylglucosamine transferase